MVEHRQTSPPTAPPSAPSKGIRPCARDVAKSSTSRGDGSFRTLLAIAGIYVSFLTQGVVQESIYAKTGKNEPFRCPLFLVAMVCMLSCLFGLVLSRVTREEQVLETAALLIRRGPKGCISAEDKHLLAEGLRISLSYVGAMVATNFALTRINYPTQVLVKSAKAIPVIIGGLFLGKKYRGSDYLLVLLVTGALIVFQYGNLRMSSSSDKSTIAGFVALFCSLALDGVTGPRQDRLVTKRGLGTGDLMLLINMFAGPLCLTLSLLLEGAAPYVQVTRRLSFFMPRIAAFVLCGAMGQIFVVRVLRALGSLHLTLITTTRKFFAILISVIWFRHPLSASQWLSVLIIFSSGYIKFVAEKSRSNAVKAKSS